MKKNSDRGSIWRRWDLHIHSPHSVLNSSWQHKGRDFIVEIIKKSREAGVFALGITDYYSIDGYAEFRMFIDDDAFRSQYLEREEQEHLAKMLILPNIEFRGPELVTKDKKTGRPNYHVLFSDTVDVEDIRESFLGSLQVTISGIGSQTDRSSLRRAEIDRLGRRLKSEHPKFSDESDTFVGMMNIAVHIDEVVKVLRERKSLFGGKWLIAVSADEDLSQVNWDSQGHLTRKLYSQYPNIIFSGNTSTRDFFLGRKHSCIDDFKTEFGPIRPCMSFCDAHTEMELFQYPQGKGTWIKADLTFAGLLQTLNEPEDRVYIGDEPPQSLRSRRESSKIIDEIIISPNSQTSSSPAWFNCRVPLNPGMVAVIGNKGSGKSAFADILALTCRTRPDDFSFLNNERFRNRKTGKASEYSSTIKWLDNNTTSIGSLAEDPDDSDTTHIQYLPQSALERICNEIHGGKDSEFYREIEDVVFRHLPEDDRLWYSNLRDLIESDLGDVEKQLVQKVLLLRDQNQMIISEEEKTTDEYQGRLQNLIKQKERELASHDNSKPSIVEKPDPTDESNGLLKQLNANIFQIDDEIKRLEKQIATATETRKNKRLAKRAATSIQETLNEIELQSAVWKSDMQANLVTLGLAFDQVVSIEITTSEVERLEQVLSNEIAACDAIIEVASEGSIAYRLASKKKERDALVTQLGEPQRLYDEYLAQLNEWNQTRQKLVGSTDESDTLEGLRARLVDAKNAKDRLSNAYNARLDLCKEIHRQKRFQRDQYREYYKPVQKLTASQNTVGQAAESLRFKVFIRNSGFIDQFLEMINQGRTGTFHGIKEGREILERMVESIDWDEEDDVIAFVDQLRNALTHNRSKTGNPIAVADQLTDRASTEDVWNMIYGLEWLEPTFTLEWNGTPIETLSPGERGTLLLIFYLLLDARTDPLIIDQPEENLDNETVYSVLVPCIREARKRRQIIMITHNPNIAVVCDADQIIHAHKDMSRNPKIVYSSGSIENPQMNQLLVDVLEGTKPAFEMRDAKYGLGF
jgi:ABC-type lipoprotein export system ATPase subunit